MAKAGNFRDKSQSQNDDFWFSSCVLCVYCVLFVFFWRSQHLSVICLHIYRASTSFVGFVAYFFSFVAYVACAALDGNHALALYVRYEVGPKCGIDKHLKVCANVIGKNRMSFLLTQTSLVSSVFNETKDS